MIILDTNVLSALMRPQPDGAVLTWLDQQPVESIWLTSITIFEVLFGIELVAPGKRREHLENAFARMLQSEFQGRILPFDRTAAEEAARLAARRQRSGTPVDFRDTEIAGIVIARRATLATRNQRHFRDLGVDLVDPWAH